ncbi:MAG: CcmD family protein [Calditrichaeota bacterium]|nr:CcmD family protein [Calditrichota bacterium]
MSNLTYLFIAYAFIWTAIFLYLLNIGKKLSFMQREIKLLKENSHKSEDF